MQSGAEIQALINISKAKGLASQISPYGNKQAYMFLAIYVYVYSPSDETINHCSMTQMICWSSDVILQTVGVNLIYYTLQRPHV